MAALRGLLHIPRTAVREIKLSSTPASSSSSRTDSLSCLIASGKDASVRPLTTGTETVNRHAHHKQNSFLSATASVQSSNSAQGASYHSLAGGTGHAASDHNSLASRDGGGGGNAYSCHVSGIMVQDFRRCVSTQPPEKPKGFMEGVFSNMKEEFRYCSKHCSIVKDQQS